MRFTDGTLAEAPIAPCEVQGYVYDAKLRTAELAREVWRDRTLAERLEREAAELKQRFDEAFWCDRGYYALALDKDKRHVDSLTSNIGHLLWSGIVPEERVEQLVDALMGEALWSGWGVRTMSTADAGYNPLAYHNGTVWPHDNSLCAAGFARYGRWAELHRVVRRMLAASRHFDHQLPRCSPGCRGRTRRFRSAIRRRRVRRRGRPGRPCCSCSSCWACRPTAPIIVCSRRHRSCRNGPARSG